MIFYKESKSKMKFLFFGGGMRGTRVSELFLQRIQKKKKKKTLVFV